ncbi:hypothetical protein [Arthrobacter sp. K5]|uniref:Uncharacterized protein n=1 Tax=Arthrobacter sp. K5 TaxID=2839623 RepID=A0AAU8EWJ3_9MICC
MTVANKQNWSGLTAGQQVTVQEPAGDPYHAVVDAMTADSSVI